MFKSVTPNRERATSQEMRENISSNKGISKYRRTPLQPRSNISFITPTRSAQGTIKPSKDQGNNQSTTDYSTYIGFKVLQKVKMPDRGGSRASFQRLAQLLERPGHKEVKILDRSASPMTMEDRSQILADQVLIQSLRGNSFFNASSSKASQLSLSNNGPIKQQSEKEAPKVVTVPNPPSFYENDLEKWHNKFQKSVQERINFKKVFYNTQEMSSINKNTNVTNQALIFGNRVANNAQGVKQEDSIFKKVMNRRKSRQSTRSPNNIDFDYTGNSGTFQHLIEKRKELGGTTDSSQLNFEMKLRGYKNNTSFIAEKPWLYPPQKEFHPQTQYDAKQQEIQSTIGEYIHKYNDKFKEKNANNLRHLFEQKTIIQGAIWECDLRGGKDKKSKSEIKHQRNQQDNSTKKHGGK